MKTHLLPTWLGWLHDAWLSRLTSRNNHLSFTMIRPSDGQRASKHPQTAELPNKPLPGRSWPDRIHLAAGEVIRLTKASGVEKITVPTGAVWLTETPGNADHVLCQGEAHRLEGHWPVVLQALQPAELHLD